MSESLRQAAREEADDRHDFRAELDHILTADPQSVGQRKTDVTELIGSLNARIAEAAEDSPERAEFQQLAAEAEALLLKLNEA